MILLFHISYQVAGSLALDGAPPLASVGYMRITPYEHYSQSKTITQVTLRYVMTLNRDNY